MNELINDMRWLAYVLLFICAICDANDDLGAYTACRYSHDGTGNRTEKDCDGQKTRYAYNSLDQLTEEQTATGPKTTYRWDGRGNLLEKSTPSATIRYEWSSDNRLLKASDGSASIRYGYDALGRRISRTQETGGQKQETQWILDTARPYSEIVLERSRQNGGAWQETRYTHTPDGVGQLISEQRQGKTLHVYEDGQGSARLITDESGQIIETLDFDAFGNEEAGNPQESRHRYTGESYDSATGLYHLRARDYDPKTGRFVSMDEHPGSQSIPLTLNKYLYGNADPVNHVDPSGNMGMVAVMPGISIDVGRFSTALAQLAPIAKNLTFAAGRFVLGKMVVSAVNMGTFSIANSLARRCIKNGTIDKNCRAGFNIFIVGDLITPEHHALVTRAITFGAQFSLTRREPPHSRGWLRKLGCMGSRNSNLDCDEYPYASTHQGGADGLSTFHILNARDNRIAGGILSAFYAQCKIKGNSNYGDQFFVIPIKGAPTVGVCQ